MKIKKDTNFDASELVRMIANAGPEQRQLHSFWSTVGLIADRINRGIPAELDIRFDELKAVVDVMPLGDSTYRERARDKICYEISKVLYDEGYIKVREVGRTEPNSINPMLRFESEITILKRG